MRLHLVVAILTLWCGGVAAQGQQFADTNASDAHLKEFLQSYLVGTAPRTSEESTRFSVAKVRLSGNGAGEFIVYVMGPNWCGSGGCTALVIAPEGSSYKVITKMTIVRLPVRILASRTNGWRDIGVKVRGGSATAEYEAQLRFNGKKYPSNPTVAPAERAKPGTLGDVVIPNTVAGASLFP